MSTHFTPGLLPIQKQCSKQQVATSMGQSTSGPFLQAFKYQKSTLQALCWGKTSKEEGFFFRSAFSQFGLALGGLQPLTRCALLNKPPASSPEPFQGHSQQVCLTKAHMCLRVYWMENTSSNKRLLMGTQNAP